MKEKGYITVYLSLVLIVILAVLFTTLESARISGARMRYQVVTLLGLESTFADYYTPLLKEYGLLFLNSTYQTGNINEFEHKLREYIEYNLYPNKGLLFRGNNLYGSSLNSIDIIEKTLATSYGGDVFEGEILNYMGHAMPVDSVIWVLEEAGLVEESKVVKKVFDSLFTMQGVAEKVDKTIHNISESLSTIREYKDNFEEYSDDLKKRLLDLEELYQMESSIEGEEEMARFLGKLSSAKKAAKNQLNAIIKNQETLKNFTELAISKEEDYRKWTEEFMEDLLIVEAEVEADINKLSGEMQTIISEEFETMKIFSGGQSDYYKIEEVGNLLKENKGILETNIESLTSFSGAILESEIGGLLSALNQWESSMREYHKENLVLNYEDGRVENTDSNVLKEIERLMKDGIYSLVIPKSLEVSKKTMEFNRLPSLGFVGGSSKENALLGDISKTLLTNEYIAKKFGNAVEVKEEKALDYEVEYVLEGNPSDEENLKGIITRLLGIREGMNLLYLFSDSEKRQEAEVLAISLVGFTGMYGLIKITQLLILATWAFVESIIDIRDLLHGNPVELRKDASNWQTSILGLISFSKEKTVEKISQTNNKKGLKYLDYLRLLLLTEKRKDKLYRSMDLIQENIRKSYDKGFYMENCLYSIEIKATYKVNQLFLTLPIMKGYTGSDQKYGFSIEKSYSYE